MTWIVRWLAAACLLMAAAGIWMSPSDLRTSQRAVTGRVVSGAVSVHGPRTTVHAPQSTPHALRSLTGRVVSGSEPVGNARVRFQGESSFVATDDQGRFALGSSLSGAVHVTASKEGYFIAGGATASNPLQIELARLPEEDFDDYSWVGPEPDDNSPGNCGNCHREIYNEWRDSGHASSANNRHFQNLFDGTDWQGEPGKGWSLLDEYPAGAGVCAACHAPTADPSDPIMPDAEGIHCDFCHKIRSARVEQVGLTHGRYAYDLLRPSEGQIFFGPLDDVDRGEDVHSPLQSESRYCAGCHEGVVFGVHVYSTWSEWLDSPARRQGRQCQTCHMAPSGTLTNIAPGHGGVERDPATLASHTMLPGGRESMLRGALRVSVQVNRSQDQVAVAVRIGTENVGHKLPTGFIDRHLVLVIDPRTSDGSAIDVTRGPTLPQAAGAELVGRPGRLFARLLTDTEGRPAPFWRTGLMLEDTRLTPNQPETFRFVLPDDATSIGVRLLYRRFWPEVTESKNWPEDEIIVFDETFDCRPNIQ